MTYPNLYHIQYFVDAVELGGISAAARKNFVSHSAVSQAIKSVESHFNLKLISHKKKSFEVTPSGYSLVTRAKDLLLVLETLSEKSKVADSEIKGKMVLGMSRSLAQAYLGTILNGVKKNYPMLQLEVKFGTTTELMEKTLQEEVDVSVTIGRHMLPTLNQKLLRKGNFVLVAPELKDKESELSYIVTEPKYETELLKKNYLAKYKTELPVYLEVGSWDTIMQLVSEGHGYGLVPDIAANANKNEKVKKIATPWYDCPCEVYLNEKKNLKNKELKASLKTLLSKTIR